MDIDPYEHDPARWAHSLAHLTEILLPCLDAAGARSVVEVGAYAGDLTRVLLEWAARSGARVSAIDPTPHESLVRLAETRDGLELVRETSLEALPRIQAPDAVIIDGDHNYYTVAEELRATAARADGSTLPLLLVHDVCWPHGRRDNYFEPDRIPPESRHEIAEGGGLIPGDPGVRPGGLPYRAAAAREGGPRNGVLTALEDFVGERDGLRLAVVPAFFGLGVVWDRAAPWADAVQETLRPWDRNTLLARLEENRAHHLAHWYLQTSRTAQAEERAARQEALLRRMLESSAFGLADRVSRLRKRVGIASEQEAVSRDAIRRVLGG
jgi:hypothetical protein